MNSTEKEHENTPRILVMGGAGYIGSHTVRLLCDCGYKVTVADNLIYGHREAVDKRAEFVHADLLDINSLRELFSQNHFDKVVHFAAFAYVGESVTNPSKYYLNNVTGTINLLNMMLAYDVKNIVFSSTCATYGEPQYTPIDEKHPQAPINPYGASKLMIERVLDDYHKAYGLNYIALRYFNAAGASSDGVIGESHDPEPHIIPRVLKAIIGEIKEVQIMGTDYDTRDGTCVRDYIHVEDLALAHKLALEKLSEYSGYLNLGTGIGTTVNEIIKVAERVTGKKCTSKIVERRPGDPAKLTANNVKAKEVLGWTPTKSIDEIIESAWTWEVNKKY